jgi:thiamine-monophosphate kinase
MTDVPLGPGREFDLVREMQRRWGTLARGLGDDAAILDVPPGERLVVSTDASVEDVHFRRGWLAPEEIGWRATAAALSDLAAMAATPLGFVVAITLPDEWRDALPGLVDGIGQAAREAATAVIGGDLTRGPGLALTITVLGHTRAPLTRAGARPGDALWVTGRLGGPLSALRAFERGERPAPAHRERFARPRPRLVEARWLAAHGAHAAIDVSDGLLAEAGHLAAAGGVRIAVELDAVPCIDGVSAESAVRGGEEYELLVCAPATIDHAAFEATFGLPLTRVGVVEAGAPVAEARRRGVRVDLATGHDHFSG